MEHIAALLLVVSCSPDLTGCREVTPPTAVFEAFDDCQSQLPQALRTLAPDNSRLFAKCLQVDPALEDDYDQLTWKVMPNGTFLADLSISGVVTASNTTSTTGFAQ